MTRPEEHIEWLYRRQRLGVTLGLERTLELLASVGNPHESFRTVLVGGTNGKGSTARVLSSCLETDGVATALYISPHLSRLGERYVVGGREMPRDRVAAAIGRLRDVAETLSASFFEVLTAAACLLFRDAGVQIAVMEVGLGGRFDATNALEPELSLITSVSLDHTDLLGSTPSAIAREKAGILRTGRLAITAAREEALDELRQQAVERGARLWVAGEDVRVTGEQLGWAGQTVEVICPAGSAGGSSPLVGAHQQENLALAVAAALALGVSAEAVEEGLAKATWPGRLERRLWRGRWLVFDGAHNVRAAEALGKTLDELEGEPYTLVVGMGKDKDLPGLAAALRGGSGRVFATRARHSPRAREPFEVAAAFGPEAAASDDPAEALERALAATAEGGTVVVAGSLYLVGELRPLVVNEEFEAAERWQ